jgi:hypothetical protein
MRPFEPKRAPGTNFQAPEKFQEPGSKIISHRFPMFEVWGFSGAWCLDFGASVYFVFNSSTVME